VSAEDDHLDSILSLENTKRAISELVLNSENGINGADLNLAMDAVYDMAVACASFTLWSEGHVTFGWRDGELAMFLTKAAE